MQSHANTELQSRIARSCMDAAFGYARAMTAAYAALAEQTLEFWASAAKHTTGKRGEGAPISTYYIEAPRRSSVPSIPTPLDVMQVPDAWRDISRTALAPVAAWWGLAPFQSNPASWPMAYSMMLSGVPRAVALPAAEANVAAMDAANAATASITEAFSSYRSASGFAMPTVIAPPNPATTSPRAPYTPMTMLAPWLNWAM